MAIITPSSFDQYFNSFPQGNGINPYQFTYNDLINVQNEYLSSIVTTLSLTPENPIYSMVIGGATTPQYYLWSAVSAVVNQYNPYASSGYIQDQLLGFLGFVRKQSSPSQVVLTFIGQAGALIPAGTQFSDVNNNVFYTQEDYTIPSTGTINANAYALSGGYVYVTANTITRILNPIPQLQSVNNANPSFGGQNRESDAEFLNRWRNGFGAIGSTGGLQQQFQNIAGNTYANVFVNNTDSTVNGVPAYSMQVTLSGSMSSTDIANVFYNNLNTTPLALVGDTMVTYNESETGQSYNFYYQSSNSTIIYFALSFKFLPFVTQVNSADMISQIQNNIIYYLNTQPLGATLTQSNISNAIMQGQGSTTTNLTQFISIVPNTLVFGINPLALSPNDLTLNKNQYPIASASNINVTYTP